MAQTQKLPVRPAQRHSATDHNTIQMFQEAAKRSGSAQAIAIMDVLPPWSARGDAMQLKPNTLHQERRTAMDTATAEVRRVHAVKEQVRARGKGNLFCVRSAVEGTSSEARAGGPLGDRVNLRRPPRRSRRTDRRSSFTTRRMHHRTTTAC